MEKIGGDALQICVAYLSCVEARAVRNSCRVLNQVIKTQNMEDVIMKRFLEGHVLDPVKFIAWLKRNQLMVIGPALSKAIHGGAMHKKSTNWFHLHLTSVPSCDPSFGKGKYAHQIIKNVITGANPRGIFLPHNRALTSWDGQNCFRMLLETGGKQLKKLIFYCPETAGLKELLSDHRVAYDGERLYLW